MTCADWRLDCAGSVRVVVATIAFGMGIDKPDVRAVVHWTVASSVQVRPAHTPRLACKRVIRHCACTSRPQFGVGGISCVAQTCISLSSPPPREPCE